MNLRPSGYEPDELPDCSTPRHHLRNIALAAARDRDPGLGGRSKPSSCKDHRNRLACDGIALGRPGSDLLSHTLRCSTIGAEGLHGRVRDGIGCVPLAIATRSSKRDAGTGPPYAPPTTFHWETGVCWKCVARPCPFFRLGPPKRCRLVFAPARESTKAHRAARSRRIKSLACGWYQADRAISTG